MHSPSWITGLKTVFSLDLRSLALLRVLLALMLLWDLALRSTNLQAFYTDRGVLPREFLHHIAQNWHWSLHAASGDLWWQILLFVVAALAAIALLMGYHTRTMAFISFVLLASVINRNPLLATGGDQLQIVMCFWSLFLPMSARWSVDAALQQELKTNPNLQRFNPDKPQLYFSVATIAVVLQVLYLYFFTALFKTGDAWTSRFDAAFYAVQIEQLATPIAIWVRQFPSLLQAGTVYVLAVEFIAPLLVLAPFLWPRLRLIGLLLLISLHITFVFMLHIGLFPFIDLMSLSILVPSAVWIALHQRRKRSNSFEAINGITIYYDEDCGFCLKMCLILRELLLHPSVPILTAQSNPNIHAVMEKHNSWVIRGPDNTTYIHWHAMHFLFNQRMPFKPIAWLMKLKILMALGNKAYAWVAINRGTMSNITAVMLPWRQLNLRPNVLGSVLAGYIFVCVTVFNITTLPGNQQYRPEFVETTIRLTRLDQQWSMFAPFPLLNSVYPQIPGRSRGGEDINLYPNTEPHADWEPPSYLASVYSGYRWRKYLGRVESHENDKVRNGYGRYLCNRYNAGRSDQTKNQLAFFEIWFVNRRTNTTGQAKSVSRKRAWRHWCFPEFKGASM